jgi:diacylglycerol kinase (ATP)
VCIVPSVPLTVIVSPFAGSGRGRALEPALARQLESAANPSFVYPASLDELRDAVRGVRSAGATHLGVAGGDGTLHHVVNALEGATVTLVVLPIGSGNDFARGFGLENGRAVQAFAAGKQRTVDLVEVNGHRVCTVAGLGLVADCGIGIGRLLSPASRVRFLARAFGSTTYLVGAAARIFAPRRISSIASLRWRDLKGQWQEWEGSLYGAFLANLRTLGAGLQLPVPAVPDDGAFELAVLPTSSRMRLVLSLSSLRGRRRLRPGTLIVERTSEAELAWTGGSHLLGDGEDLGRVERVRVRSLPRALTVSA